MRYRSRREQKPFKEYEFASRGLLDFLLEPLLRYTLHRAETKVYENIDLRYAGAVCGQQFDRHVGAGDLSEFHFDLHTFATSRTS